MTEISREYVFVPLLQAGRWACISKDGEDLCTEVEDWWEIPDEVERIEIVLSQRDGSSAYRLEVLPNEVVALERADRLWEGVGHCSHFGLPEDVRSGWVHCFWYYD